MRVLKKVFMSYVARFGIDANTTDEFWNDVRILEAGKMRCEVKMSFCGLGSVQDVFRVKKVFANSG